MKKLLYHHARDLNFVEYGKVNQTKLSQILEEPQCLNGCPKDLYNCPWHDAKLFWEPCYEWLEKRIGFYPLFLSVGKSIEDIRMTGYNDNWRKKIGSDTNKKSILREKGSYPNQILFSWYKEPNQQIKYTDFLNWHLVLNSVEENTDKHSAYIRDIQEETEIFQPSYNKNKWIKQALKEPHSVQALVPYVDLSTADEIWCRNQSTRQKLIEMGWDSLKIKVKRIAVSGA